MSWLKKKRKWAPKAALHEAARAAVSNAGQPKTEDDVRALLATYEQELRKRGHAANADSLKKFQK